MENTTIKSHSLKNGLAIKILSIVSLVCTVLNCIPYFFYYDSEKVNGEVIYELTFSFPHFIRSILLLLTITPIILLILYIFKFYNKLKATILVPIIFSLLSLKIVLGFFWGEYYGIFLIIGLLAFAAHILAIISALKGFNKKIFIVIAMSVCLFYEALSLLNVFSIIHAYIEYSMYLYLFTSPMSIIGSSTLYVTLLLFGLKNRIPSIISLSPKKVKEKEGKFDPEQALKVLKEQFDFGTITEEEYKTQRSEIISKL